MTDTTTSFEGKPLRDPDDPLFPQTADPPLTWPDRTYYIKWLEGLTVRPGEGVYPNYVIFYRTWCPHCGRRLESAGRWLLRQDMNEHYAFLCHPETWEAVPDAD